MHTYSHSLLHLFPDLFVRGLIFLFVCTSLPLHVHLDKRERGRGWLRGGGGGGGGGGEGLQISKLTVNTNIFKEIVSTLPMHFHGCHSDNEQCVWTTLELPGIIPELAAQAGILKEAEEFLNGLSFRKCAENTHTHTTGCVSVRLTALMCARVRMPMSSCFYNSILSPSLSHKLLHSLTHKQIHTKVHMFVNLHNQAHTFMHSHLPIYAYTTA